MGRFYIDDVIPPCLSALCLFHFHHLGPFFFFFFGSLTLMTSATQPQCHFHTPLSYFSTLEFFLFSFFFFSSSPSPLPTLFLHPLLYIYSFPFHMFTNGWCNYWSWKCIFKEWVTWNIGGYKIGSLRAGCQQNTSVRWNHFPSLCTSLVPG